MRKFQLCETDARTGVVRVVRYVSLEEATRLVEREKADPVLHCDSGKVLGFELRAISRPAAREPLKAAIIQRQEAGARKSCTAFSKREVEAIIGVHGKSQTAHLTDDQKADRIRRRWCAEDIVESAQQKLAVYRTVR